MPPGFPAPGDLLPHRPPLLLLRVVRGYTRRRKRRCEACFDDDFARLCGGEVPAVFGLELIAQAAAVHHALCQFGRVGREDYERAVREDCCLAAVACGWKHAPYR